MKQYLVVVDIQNDFVDGALGTVEAVGILYNACRRIREFEGDIFVTYDTHFENYMDLAEGEKLPVPHCIKGTSGWEIHERIQGALKGKCYTPVEKHTFGSTKLPELIRSSANGEPFSITLIGLCTDICVVSNALLLKANFPDMKITVVADCCAGVTVDSHNAALITMKMCQIDIINE